MVADKSPTSHQDTIPVTIATSDKVVMVTLITEKLRKQTLQDDGNSELGYDFGHWPCYQCSYTYNRQIRQTCEMCGVVREYACPANSDYNKGPQSILKSSEDPSPPLFGCRPFALAWPSGTFRSSGHEISKPSGQNIAYTPTAGPYGIHKPQGSDLVHKMPRSDGIQATDAPVQLLCPKTVNFTATVEHKSISGSPTLGLTSPADSSTPLESAQGTHLTLETPPFCPHCQYKDKCTVCDPVANTPPAPPKKRHCRSLSIPGDGSVNWPTPQGSHMFRPVAIRSHLNNNRLVKNCNSPLGHHSGSNSSIGPHITGVVPPSGLWMTPPESPIPRPASASSGFYESSFSSLSAPWFDNSPNKDPKYDALKSRSLSLEDPISSQSQDNSTSMPTMPGCHGSTPSSPRRQRIPRCRSQPSVLNDRKGGLKRRRGEDRPALDFHKMKETAYDHRTTRRRNLSEKGRRIPSPQAHNMRSSRSLASVFSEHENSFGLKTIASSPLDSVVPLVITPVGSPPSIVALTNIEKPGDPEPFFDSGCSDIGDPSESISSFVTAEENYEGENSMNSQDTLFEIDVHADLDLDQIEKD